MVAAVNSSAMLIASRYETARSSRVRAPFLIHYNIFQKSRYFKRKCDISARRKGSVLL